MSVRLALAWLCAAIVPVRAEVGIRVVLGITDKEPAQWDGSASVDRGRITRIDPWRFSKEDEILGQNSWKVSTRPLTVRTPAEARPVVSNGIILWLSGEDENTEIKLKTAQGDFSLRLSDLPYGKFGHALAGRVAADRIPPSVQVTSSLDEQDYPAAALAANGDIWLAYLEFRHNPDHDKLRAPLTAAPKDFAGYNAPTGGDQVLVKRLSQNRWSEPIAITPPGGDLYRPSIAVDGSGRPWVFWSANEKGNFDLWARPIQNGAPGKAVRISDAPGSDVFPAAATDAGGHAWVAWQGWRQGKAAIFAATQQGDNFSAAAAVSNSAADEWNPAIAADATGRVTVAWDSYRNGSFDIYARTATAAGAWGPEIAVAATAKYEAYPSIAYDAQGRLWMAYEEGPEGWGKDFGAYRSTGVSVYFARAVRLIGLDSSGRLIQPESDLGAALPGVAAVREDTAGRQSEAVGWEKPDVERAARREPNAHPMPPPEPRNTLPRLTVDASGRIWLAFRSSHPTLWNPIGTVWSEYVASFDGKSWTGPIYLFRSDNVLDNRPALVSRRAGDLMVLESSDYRREIQLLTRRGWDMSMIRTYGLPDPYNNDLYASVLTLPPATQPVAGRDLGPPPPPTLVSAGASSGAQRSAISKLHDYRVKGAAGDLKLVRGEFHRHSEISYDGALDGTLLDQWRYILDAVGLDWVGCCDHDNGGAREYTWWTTQKLTDMFYTPGKFTPMFSYERSVAYPEGHRNVIFAQRGVRPLPRLPITKAEATGPAPDTQMFYDYLKQFGGVTASHTSGTDMGTDWRNNDPDAEPIVEIYQGMRQNYEMPDAPRSNSEKDSIGGWRPKGFINLALERGYQFGFEASSDHVSTHMSYTIVLVANDGREAILEGLRKRHVYAATDNILADVSSGSHLMGDVFSTAEAPELRVKLSGTAPFARVHIVKDNQYVYTTEPGAREVEFRWRDNAPRPGKTSYYYVRGEQQDGELVWASPFWITYTGK
jgi:hypothetical protein